MDNKVELVNKLILRISKGKTDALDELFEEVGGQFSYREVFQNKKSAQSCPCA